MANRLDIQILKILSKVDDSLSLETYINLTEKISKQDYESLKNYCWELENRKLIIYNKGNGKNIIAKIMPLGRDYLLDYKNRSSTRKIAYWGIALAIFSILIASLSLILQYKPFN